MTADRTLDQAMGMDIAPELRARVRRLAGDCPDCGAEHDPDECGAGVAGCDCCASIEAEEQEQ